MDSFKGQILHSTRHKKATDHAGKKVVVVGAGSSAHDICTDYYEHDVDVTMYQRGSTYVMTSKNAWKVIMGGAYTEGGLPVDVADRITASFPRHFNIGLAQRSTKAIAELDKDLLDALRARGFQLNFGIQGTGFDLLASTRSGGYYLDVGGSELIADGKIKLKSGSPIETFTETGIKFEDGSEIPADVVVFATGLGDSRSHIRQLVSDDVFKNVKPIWGLNPEGEMNGVWRDIGVKGLWSIIGNLALSRFYSKHVALQIKAMEEGIFGERYSAKTRNQDPKPSKTCRCKAKARIVVHVFATHFMRHGTLPGTFVPLEANAALNALPFPLTRSLSPTDLIRIRANTNEDKSTVIEWQGQVLSYSPGERPKVIFKVKGMSVTRVKKLENGSYDLLTREVQLYLDPSTEEVLEVWHNPWSDKDVN
ncbi:hypothetical protein H0H93_002696, partial [Arthromyces matolae]